MSGIKRKILLASLASMLIFSSGSAFADNTLNKTTNEINGDIILQNGTPLYEDYISNANNFSKRNNSQKYIVIHDTANEDKDAGADNHRKYFQKNDRGVSIHYVVDKTKAIHVLPDNYSAHHVGDRGNYFGDKTNYTTIGIELCVNDDKISDGWRQVIDNGVALVKELMQQYDIPSDRVIMHRDSSGKQCSQRLIENDEQGWKEFKDMIENKSYEKEIKAVKETDLNMRSGPGKDYSKVAYLPKGTIVEAFSEFDGWVRVNYENQTGYVSSSYLVDIETNTL